MSLRSRKVVLFSPSYGGKVFGPPLGLLSLAASLRLAGYTPVIIDGAIDSNWRTAITREIEDCLCFGVSVLTGPVIRDVVEASRLVRQLKPSLTIVYGGWHPSLLTKQTLDEDYVDVVVRHQGEKTLVEILSRIERGNGLDMVPGCWFKRDGRIHENADRPTTLISELPAPAYDLIDWPAYERACGQRRLPYATSIGCPYACNYCTDTVFYNRRFNAYGTEQVVSEVVDLVRRHNLDEVALVDSNFLVDVHRVVAISEGFVRQAVPFRWSFQASTDLLCRMRDEDVQLMADSGVSHIGFGTESASPEILRKMNKQHQEIPDMYEAARKCCRAGIRVTFNLIFGYPGEEERHRRETLRVMGDIAARFDNVSFSPNIFTPYPGIPIWPELRTLGLAEPESLEQWSQIDLGGTTLPWLQGKVYAELQRSISYFLLDNQINGARKRSQSPIAQWLLAMLRRPLHWRIRNHRFQWPVELWLTVARKWLVLRRSLLTGEPLRGN